MIRTEAGAPRGILRLKGVEDDRIQYSRRLPAAELRWCIEHYWLIDWDLTGQESAETLPHPSVHVVFEKDRSRVVGVIRGRFTRILEGTGRVFGIKFRPGAFYPFVGTPVARFTGRVLDVVDVFGEAGTLLEANLLTEPDEQGRVDAADRFLRERVTEVDDTVALIARIVSRVIDDRDIRKVDDLVPLFGVSRRSLQRLFHQYVGITPKWMIQRYRLHDALEHMASRTEIDWAKLALDLGYCDQPHFIKDFRTVVGSTPGEYLRIQQTALSSAPGAFQRDSGGHHDARLPSTKRPF